MNKQNRLILIDGSAYIFRAYYALPPMSRKDGTPVNAVFGFTNMLVKLIEDYREDRLIVIFDAARENFRNKIYSEYKANRGETPEDLIPQFDLIKKSVEAFNIPQLELEGYEADDIIATYTKNAQQKKINSLIISSDKDLMQLVNENVEMLDPMKNKKIGINEVIEKFGVGPNKVTQIQALTGDKIDNIPGAQGIGPKTALELIKEFGDIEKLIKSVDRIKQEKRKKIINDSKEDIRLSLKLVKLDKDIELPLSIEEIIPYNKLENDFEKINRFLVEQDFKAIIQRLENNFFIKKNNKQHSLNQENTKLSYITINNLSDLNSVIKNIVKKGLCSIDVETDSLDIEDANLVGISLSSDLNTGYYIPIKHKNVIDNKIIKDQISQEKVLNLINSLCSNTAIIKVGQNIKYDVRILKKYNIKFNSIDDTMLMSYALDNGLNKHNLDDLAFVHLNNHLVCLI